VDALKRIMDDPQVVDVSTRALIQGQIDAIIKASKKGAESAKGAEPQPKAVAPRLSLGERGKIEHMSVWQLQDKREKAKATLAKARQKEAEALAA